MVLTCWVLAVGTFLAVILRQAKYSRMEKYGKTGQNLGSMNPYVGRSTEPSPFAVQHEEEARLYL